MSEFLYIDHTGKQQGPAPSQALRQLLQQGRIHPETPVWRAGMANWAPANTLPELTAAPAPMPARPGAAQQAGTPRPSAQRSPAAKSNARLWVLLAVGGGGFLLLACGGVLVISLIASGGNRPPTQLAGKWSGELRLDVARSPHTRDFAHHPNAQQAIPFDFECTADGKVRFGIFGTMVPYDLHAGQVKQHLFVMSPNKKALLTEFSTTADTCRFTIVQVTERDVNWGGPGTDLVITNARKDTLTVTVRRVGDRTEVEFVTASTVEPAITFTGVLQRR
jgi:hypothetical protein